MKLFFSLIVILCMCSYFACSIIPKKSPESYMEAGKKCYDKKDYVKAYKNYSRAIKLNSGLFQAYWERSQAEIGMDSLERAIDDIGVYIGLTTDQKILQTAYYQRGVILEKRGYKSDACDDWKTACENLNLNKGCDMYRLKCK